MRLSSSLLRSAAVLSVLLLPAAGQAQTAHTWCTTGAPIPASSDSIVSYVCNQTSFANCCEPTGRWSLACVQAAADYARSSGMGDVCGRFAWTQGRLADTQQYYPRDFSLVALGGGVVGFQDVHGPIAVQGDVTASGFALNSAGQNQPVGLIGKGNVTLTSGTIYGRVSYGKSYRDTWVTYVNGARPTSPSQPIDFAALSSGLQAMSKAVSLYVPIPNAPTKLNGKVTFSGTDPEMNVFTVSANVLSGAATYFFDVPKSAVTIINVTGTSMAFQNSGFDGTNGLPSRSRIFWNFPDATSLSLSSITFPGSILAPYANAKLSWGQINGTVVVKSANPATSEIHWAPFQFSACCGCLCRDAGWSCSADTCLDDAGHAVVPAAEAGFLEIPYQTYQSVGIPNRASPKHRIWYSFQPASSSPENKPLAVLFNGGPGSATSAYLFTLNTAPWTLDPTTAGSKIIVANGNTWTSFANLLYVDAPATGFSYPLLPDDGSRPSLGIDIDRDAAIVAQVVVRFLDRHPLLQRNRVMLVAESYGGVRATLMLEHILNYQKLADPSDAYQDAGLYGDLVNHFTQIYPQQDPHAVTPDQIAGQFSHQAMIQAIVAGKYQYDANTPDSSGCVAGYDKYQCSEKDPWYWNTTQDAAGHLTDLAILRQALGVNPASIAWMYAGARAMAYGRNAGSIIDAPQMREVFGELGAEDNYFLSLNSAVSSPYDGSSRVFYQDTQIGLSFLKNARHVRTFITNGRRDLAVWAPAIPVALGNASYATLLASALNDQTPRPGFARAGWIKLNYQPGKASPVDREIRFPLYANGGHSISIREPGTLLWDISQWYSSTLQPFPVQPSP